MKNPIDVVWTVAAIAGVLGLGFVIGRMSVRVDDQDLRDSLAVYRHDSRLNTKIRDSLEGVILLARTARDIAERDAALARGAARALTASASRAGARADSLERLLAFAQTPADSIPILIAACTERRLECAELRRANDSLWKAAADDSTVKATYRAEIAAHLEQRRVDSAAAVRADRLIGQLEKSALGCHVPLIGIPCPVGVAGYNVTAKTASLGGGIPVRLFGIPTILSVTWSP